MKKSSCPEYLYHSLLQSEKSLVNFGFMAFNPFLHPGIYLQYTNIILYSLVKGTGTANMTFQKAFVKS